MNIYDSLDKIRSKPVEVRRQIVFILSAIITILIFVVWGLNMTLINNPSSIKAVVNETASTTPSEIVPVAEKSGLAGQLDRIKLGGERVIDLIKNIGQ